MKKQIKKTFSFLVLLLGFSFFCKAQDANSYFTLYPQSGSYGQVLTCSLKTKSINTVQVKINEKEWNTVPSVWSFFLDSAEEMESSFLVSVRVFETDINSKIIYEQKFNYKIDKCFPSIPSFWFKRLASGYQVFFDTQEKGSTIRYSIFDIDSEKRIDGILLDADTQSIDVNEKAILYAIETDPAGNSSSPLLYDFSVGIAYSDDFSIINPIPGTWNNSQTLVVSKQGENDLVYTTDGSDPRKSGLPYTKPVVILGNGDFKVRVYDKISHTEKQVAFSQKLSETQPSYATQSATQPDSVTQDSATQTDSVTKEVVQASATVQNDLSFNAFGFQLSDGVVKIPRTTKLSVSQNLAYGFGKSSDLVASSGEISIPVIDNCCRYLPMVVSQDGLNYRWVFLLGYEKYLENTNVISDDSGVKIISTPFSHILSFPKVSKYSVDSGAWLQTEAFSFPLVLNRKSPHEIRWQSESFKDNEIQHFFLSGKTLAENLVKFVKDKSEALSIQQVDKNVELHYELSFDSFPSAVTTDSPLLTEDFVLDVPQGDQATVLIRIAGFAGKEKKVLTGEFVSTLSVDRKLPEPPTFSLDGTNLDSAWSRNPVTVSWNYPDVGDVLYAGIATRKIETGDLNSVSQWPKVTKFDNKKRVFTVGEEDTFSSSDAYATAYTVSAYITDAAGNKSSVTTFHGVINKNAWYVSSNKSQNEFIPNGTPEAPFSSIQEALENITDVSEDSSIVLYVSGELNLDKSQDLNKSVVIMQNPSDKNRSQIKLASDVTINILGKNNLPVRVLFKGVEIVKNENENLEYNSISETKQPLLFVNNASLELSDVILTSNQKAELLTSVNSTVKIDGTKLNLNGQNSGVCASFKDSTVNFIGSDIYVTNKTFAQGLDIIGGYCSFKNGSMTLLSQSGATLGINSEKSELVVDSAVFILKAAASGRCVESWDSELSFTDSIFGLYDENKKLKLNTQEKCIWIDETSKVKRNTKNKVFGFANFK